MRKRLVQGIVAKLVNRIHTWVWVWAEHQTPCDCQGGSFSNRIRTASNKQMPRLDQHKLYSVAKEWRSGNRVPKQTCQPSLGRRQIYRRVQVKEVRLERRRNTHVLSENKAVVWTWNQCKLSFSVLLWACPVVIMATINWQLWWVCHLAC